MVHGTEVDVYYGVQITKEQYENLCEKLPMKYAKLFKKILYKGIETYLIGIKLKVIKQSFEGLYDNSRKQTWIYKKDLQDLIGLFDDKIETDKIDKFIKSKCFIESPVCQNKFVDIYRKVIVSMSQGIEEVAVGDIEGYYEYNSKVVEDWQSMVKPIDEDLPKNPGFYVHWWSY